MVSQLRPRRTGVLLVHGIGRQKPGDFLEQFRKPFEAQVIKRFDPATGTREIPAAASTHADGSTTFFYEVHWDDLIPPDLARGSVEVLQLFPLVWFPWFNKRAGLPGSDQFSDLSLLARTTGLLTVTGLFWLGSLGLLGCPRIGDAIEDWYRLKRRVERSRTRRTVHDLLRFEGRGWFDRFLDAYVGDIVSYVATASGRRELREDIPWRKWGWRELRRVAPESERFKSGLRRENEKRAEMRLLYSRILERFHDVAGAALDDHCSELMVVAHSLGSVIAYHAMSLYRTPEQRGHEVSRSVAMAEATVTCLVTIGSPLQKFAHFWPRLMLPMTAAPTIVARVKDGQHALIPAHSGFKWLNLYSPADLVSGALRSYTRWGVVQNDSVAGLGGVMTSHVAYKGNPQFVNVVRDQIGLAPSFQTSLPRRVIGRLFALGELAVFPALVLGICLLGVLTAFVAAVPGALLFTAAFWMGDRVYGWFVPTHVYWTIWKVFLWMIPLGAFLMMGDTIKGVPKWARDVAHHAVERRWSKLDVAREPVVSSQQA